MFSMFIMFFPTARVIDGAQQLPMTILLYVSVRYALPSPSTSAVHPLVRPAISSIISSGCEGAHDVTQ